MITKLTTGISSLLGTVIIIGVTIAIITGFVAYLMSIWNEQGKIDPFLIYPDSRIDPERKILYLHLKNLGTVPIKITQIEIKSKEKIDINITIHPGENKYININLKEEYRNNTTYVVVIYTDNANVNKILINIPSKS